MELESDPEYRKLAEEEKVELLNGCGPSGFDQIPWLHEFLNEEFKESCRIHDWDFEHSHIEPSTKHFKESNERLLSNMKIETTRASSLWKRAWLYTKAYIYYALCDLFGHKFYR